MVWLATINKRVVPITLSHPEHPIRLLSEMNRTEASVDDESVSAFYPHSKVRFYIRGRLEPPERGKKPAGSFVVAIVDKDKEFSWARISSIASDLHRVMLAIRYKRVADGVKVEVFNYHGQPGRSLERDDFFTRKPASQEKITRLKNETAFLCTTFSDVIGKLTLPRGASNTQRNLFNELKKLVDVAAGRR